MGLVLAERESLAGRTEDRLYTHRKRKGRHTEGIEGPQPFREALLLPEGTLIQAMVYETVHVELSRSSIHQFKKGMCIRLRLILLPKRKEVVKMTAIAVK